MFLRRLISAPSVQLFRQYSIDGKKPCDESNACTTSNVVRIGDSGTSTVLSNQILPKDNKIFSAIGATEELLSYLGLAREYAVEAEHDYIHKLKRIQTVVIDISTAISIGNKPQLKSISSNHTKELEEWIDKYATELPPIEKYIIPGGGVASASLHVARSICRRTERLVLPLVREGGLEKEALIYLNRLSDFLLALARIAAKLDKRTESIYVPSDNEKYQSQ